MVIIGATNFPERIDGAIRRSGRLDRHIAVQLPTFDEIPGILRLHLGEALKGIDLTPVALRAVGASGADLAAWVKRAKNAARRARRQMALSDLTKAVDGNHRPLSPSERWRVAIHEAGHLVATAVLDAGEIEGASISGRGGSAVVDPAFSGTTTKEDIEKHLVVLLAGRTAESLILGSFAIGSGMGGESDLSRATQIAAMLEVSVGAGRFGLVYAPQAGTEPLRNPTLLTAMRERLAEAETKAMALLERNKAALSSLATHLQEHSYISAEQIRATIDATVLQRSTP